MKIIAKYRKKFKYAIQGLLVVIKTEDSMKIHMAAAFLVIVLGLYCRLPAWKWAVLFLTIAIVVISEMFNTAVETMINLYQESYHPLAKLAKDIAAGAVLVAAIASVIAGVVVFLL
jgi:diacylglycerol kinase